MRMSASMRAPMMWPQLVMKYWQAVRRPYSATNSSVIQPSEAMMASGALWKKSFVKKLRNCGNARSTPASTVAHTRSKMKRNL